MKQDILTRLYSTVLSLEKCLTMSQEMLDEQRGQPKSVAEVLKQQEKVLVHMRRAANKVQFGLARGDWKEVTRQVQIFDGLWQMISPELMAIFSALSNRQVAYQFVDSQVAVH